ncbi:MAG TPA: type II toxin-antitoxin system VapC family toxin [Bryobacteraceae bacterium]|nr:type II toxin-antitoxin system VapC family toxin [Bryobacteraceae bacterium]
MLAIDTNVLVRFLTGDDPEEAATARELFAREQIRIAKTVLLEAEWVLRSAYGFEPGAIRDSLKRTISLPNECSGRRSPGRLKRDGVAAHGITLADALHLTITPPGGEFASFERAFIRRAKRAGAANVRDLS